MSKLNETRFVKGDAFYDRLLEQKESLQEMSHPLQDEIDKLNQEMEELTSEVEKINVVLRTLYSEDIPEKFDWVNEGWNERILYTVKGLNRFSRVIEIRRIIEDHIPETRASVRGLVSMGITRLVRDGKLIRTTQGDSALSIIGLPEWVDKNGEIKSKYRAKIKRRPK